MEHKLIVRRFDDVRYKIECHEVMNNYAIQHYGCSLTKLNEILQNRGCFISTPDCVTQSQKIQSVEERLKEEAKKVDKSKYESIEELDLLNVCLNEKDDIVYIALNTKTNKVQKFIEDGQSFEVIEKW